MQLMAQAVPSAMELPCVAHLAVGWGVGDAETIRGKATFVVGVGDGSSHPVTVVLTRRPARRRSRAPGASRSTAGA